MYIKSYINKKFSIQENQEIKKKKLNIDTYLKEY